MSVRRYNSNALPADLPRRERILSCIPEQCNCRSCGQQTSLIGYEESEQLDVEPAQYFVLVTKREKRACTVCKDGGVNTAALPARIIDKSLASDRVIIDTVVAKYCDYVPTWGRHGDKCERIEQMGIGPK